MRIAVTGGCGFIGSNLCNSLKQDGHTVVAFDNRHLGWPGNLDKVQDVQVDVTCWDDMALMVHMVKPDIIFHLAAASSSPMFVEQEIWGLNTNVMGFVNVMHHARKSGVRKVIYASSSSLYAGNAVPWIETLPIVPRTFYEASFKAREDIASAYYGQYGFKSIGLRFFSVYGPHERHKGEYANNITQFLWAANAGEALVVYGDGTQARDFIHVDDVVSALKLAMDYDQEGIFNVGTGVATSFKEVLDKLGTKLNKTMLINYIDNPIGPNYIPTTLADTSLAAEELGFKAQISVDEGINKLVSVY
jgi:UDP-glucose 4-epimerase